jgi:hypothetical protein
VRKKWLYLVPLILLGSLAFVALGGEIVRLLWNWLLPELFGWRPITFWQALGLLALCRILFGGFGRGMHGGAHRGRMARMTPEERERFRQRVRERFGFGAFHGESRGE